MCSKTVLGLFVFFSSIPVVGDPQHLGYIYRTLVFTDPLQNINITVKVCNTLVLPDDWQLGPHKSLFFVDWAYLQDTQMKDGIVSLNLTNVVNDNDGRVKPGGQGKDQDKDGGEQNRGKDDVYVGLKVAPENIRTEPLQNTLVADNDPDPTIEQNKDGLHKHPRLKCVDPQDQDGSVGLKDAQKNIIAGPGQDASLPRQDCVKNRVDLQDQETKGGDVNSTLLDAMNAERSVALEEKIRERATLILNRSIFLRFVPPVYPQDTQMKHGNGTVMIDDRGTDKFWKPLNNFTLSVDPPAPENIRTEPLQNTLVADNDPDPTIEQNKDGLHKHPRLKCVDPQDQDGSVGLKDAQKNIIAGPGQDASLPRQDCVKNRVDLQDQETKGGDVALILKDVTTNDTGRYECCVLREKNAKPISNTYLSVVPPGQPGGHTGVFFRTSCNDTFSCAI